jgi:hypothetical protein
MGIIAADADLLVERFPGGARVAGVLIAEFDMVMDVIDDRLGALPARRIAAEQAPGDIGQAVGFAIAAAQKEDQHIVGQLLDRHLAGMRHHPVGQSAIAHRRTGGQRDRTGRGHDAAAPIAEGIAVSGDRDRRVGRHDVRRIHVVNPRMMHVQHQHHRRRLETVIADFVTEPDVHGSIFLLRGFVGDIDRHFQTEE